MQLPTTRSGNHLGLRILAYYLIFFPSLDVMSAYPLVVHVLVNNIYIIITGKDTLCNYTCTVKQQVLCVRFICMNYVSQARVA